MAKSLWSISCNRCHFQRDEIATKADAKRHAIAHEGIGVGHSVAVVERPPLSKTVRKGDRVRLKEEARADYSEACKLVGYDTDSLTKVHEVTRIDNWGTGGRPRLFIAAPPYAFYPSDVELAWNSDKERRQGLGIR